MTAVPPELKQIAPFLTRANELAKAEPAIGYWCTYYALQLAIALGAKAQESTVFLLQLMDKLEELKAELASLDAVSDEAAAAAHVENFALKIFGQADTEDRSGHATRLTAKKFLAAANFLELLSIFGEMDSEAREKIKYSKWKAGDIAKAFREGRQPVPGPAGGLPEGEPILPPDSQITGDEAAALAKELAALGTAEERAENHARSASLERSRSDESAAYPFPRHPTTDPGQSSSKALVDEEPVTPAFPSFLNTPITSPGSASSEENLLDAGVTPPATHQTLELQPPTNFTSPASAFPAAVFPSAPSAPSFPSSFAPSAPPPPPPVVSFSPPPTSLPTFSPPPPPPVPTAPSAPTRSQPPPPPPPAPPAQSSFYAPAPAPAELLDPSVIATIQKHAKWAISALNYDDLETARKELRAALAMLGG